MTKYFAERTIRLNPDQERRHMTIAGHTNLTMRRDPRACRERGFTLLELMMTLAVAAILSGTAAPALGTF